MCSHLLRTSWEGQGLNTLRQDLLHVALRILVLCCLHHLLLCIPNHNVRVIDARYAAAHEDKVQRGVDAHNREVLCCGSFAPQASSHLLSRPYTARILEAKCMKIARRLGQSMVSYLMCANGTCCAMRGGYTMTGSETLEVPPLHRSLETFPDPGNLYAINDMLRVLILDTYDLAMTSTDCPGTKWTADRVVPTNNSELQHRQS